MIVEQYLAHIHRLRHLFLHALVAASVASVTIGGR